VKGRPVCFTPPKTRPGASVNKGEVLRKRKTSVFLCVFSPPQTFGSSRYFFVFLPDGAWPMTIEVPRDREGSFEPQIVPKHHGKRGFHGVPGV
jgi:hypothetical protein